MPFGAQDTLVYVTANATEAAEANNMARMCGRRFITENGDEVELQEFTSTQDVDVFPGGACGYVTGSGYKKVTTNLSDSEESIGCGACLCIINGVDLLAATKRFFGFVLVRGRPANFKAASTGQGAVDGTSVIHASNAMALHTDGSVAADTGFHFNADIQFGINAAAESERVLGFADAADSSNSLAADDAIMGF
jgi:hypothetical protein